MDIIVDLPMQVKDDKGFKLKNFESMKEQREHIKKENTDKKEAMMGIGEWYGVCYKHMCTLLECVPAIAEADNKDTLSTTIHTQLAIVFDLHSVK
jgi:hypothetical protein